MQRKPSKDELEAKIKELEEKLERLDKMLEPKSKNLPTEKIIKNKVIIGNTPIGADALETIREISQAKKNSTKKAGLVRNTDEGSVLEEDTPIITRIPTTSIHEFSNLIACECECHNRNKLDCEHCYDHPIHLENKRNMRKKTESMYTEEYIQSLIDADKAKKEKKPWWKI